jgi:hypothetical protein
MIVGSNERLFAWMDEGFAILFNNGLSSYDFNKLENTNNQKQTYTNLPKMLIIPEVEPVFAPDNLKKII